MPFSQVLAGKQQEYNKFRHALRAEDQQAFDALFEQARLHIQAAVYYSDPDPAEATFISMLIENWKVIDKLQKRMSELEARLIEQNKTNGDNAA